MYKHPDYKAKMTKGHTLFKDKVWPLLCPELGATGLEPVETTAGGLRLDLMGIDWWILFGDDRYGVSARVWSYSPQHWIGQPYPFVSVRRQTSRPYCEYHARVYSVMTGSQMSDLTVEAFIYGDTIQVVWVRTRELWQSYIDSSPDLPDFELGSGDRLAKFVAFDWPFLVDNSLVRGCLKSTKKDKTLKNP